MSNTGLIVRRTERFEISLPARVRVAMQHLEFVQFTKGVADTDRWINVDVVDFAQGGVGFVTEVFFARALDLELEIPNLADPSQNAMLRCEMQVKRVQMTDRRPGYLIGCAFLDVDEAKKTTINAMIERLLGLADSVENDGGYHA